MAIDQKPLTNKKRQKPAFIYVGISMVRLLHLTTRCTSTMAAREALRGLLHDHRSTSTPLFLPRRPPKGLACPWSTTTQANTTFPPSITYFYSQVLQAPPPTRIIPNCERDTTKLEHLIHRMRVNDIDTWLVQETWLDDDDYDTIIGGYYSFQYD